MHRSDKDMDWPETYIDDGSGKLKSDPELDLYDGQMVEKKSKRKVIYVGSCKECPLAQNAHTKIVCTHPETCNWNLQGYYEEGKLPYWCFLEWERGDV